MKQGKNLQQRNPKMWSEGLKDHKARYPLFAIIGLFIFAQLLVHDGMIYSEIEDGRSDIDALSQLFFPNWTNDEGTQLVRALLAGMAFLAGYAILVRVAQWHYVNHGVSLE